MVVKEEKKSMYKKIRQFDIRKGIYPIRVSLSVWDDGNSKPFVELYSGAPLDNGYKHSHFRITNKQVWDKIKLIIDNELSEDLNEGRKLSEKALQKIDDHEFEIMKKDNQKLKQKLKGFRRYVKEARKLRLPEYKKNLVEFKKQIDKKGKEEELQTFLLKNSWLLGLEYENAQPQKIGVRKRYDFYVEKYDGYADIVEIKKSSENLFLKNGKMSKPLADALQQLIEYIDDAIIEGDSKRISNKLQINFLKPKGILIIGKTKNEEIKQKIAQLAYYFHNIEILTYDDLYERGKCIVSSLEKNDKK
ncbi:DUF4263 domain-containing protein [Candidatus Woesearchaeota archaeon]|nr:DUF4263 domain-containing protein [Candidatus Woesearchaeota archaeon]